VTTNPLPCCPGSRVANPFREGGTRRDALKELKRSIVRLGLRSDRRSLALARWLFEDVPGLREA
jgi:hypothetical protein